MPSSPNHRGLAWTAAITSALILFTWYNNTRGVFISDILQVISEVISIPLLLSQPVIFIWAGVSLYRKGIHFPNAMALALSLATMVFLYDSFLNY